MARGAGGELTAEAREDHESEGKMQNSSRRRNDARAAVFDGVPTLGRRCPRMGGRRDVRPVHRPSRPQPQLVQKPIPRKVFSLARLSTGGGRHGLPCDARPDGQRDHALQPCICLLGHSWRHVLRAAFAHGGFLLGLCADVAAFGAALGHVHGDRPQSAAAEKSFPRAQVPAADRRSRHCRLWAFRLHPARPAHLYAGAHAVRVSGFQRAAPFCSIWTIWP